ncbi:receptor-like serine/threonine-protein kinase At1g78530 [Apium graveolens]|uniref:receptor-like serine/threonine-protein kinase At1g78530 n=1 Tax=Apium graveolens TaxID=4045 RepID=UPI003D79F87E
MTVLHNIFCVDSDEALFLLYKYVSTGNLERFLHGIAEAIGYLYSGTYRCVVHRDIKPSNILLSSNKNPKLCDFGLATLIEVPSVPFLCKTVKGTFGYLAPKYFQHGKISHKTGVYAFGVVLGEDDFKLLGESLLSDEKTDQLETNSVS